MKLKQFITNYFDNDQQIHIIALQTAAIGFIIALLYISKFHLVELMIIMTGLLMNSVMLSFNSSYYISSQRIKYGFITSITSGIAYGVGSFSGNEILLSTIFILMILPWVLFSNQYHGLIAGLFLYTFEGFILGTGMPTNNVHQIITYSLSYIVGGLLIVLSGIIRIFVLKHLKLENNKCAIKNTPYFEISARNVLYNIVMIIAVLVCNFISVNYHLVNGYWLPLTAFLIIRSNYNISISRMTLRVVGTLIGGVFTFIFCMLIHSELIFAIMIFPAFYLTVIAVSRHYGSFTALITLSIMLIIALMGDDAIYKVEHRIIYTLLAVIIVMVCLYTLKFILTKTNLNHSEIID